MQSESDRTPSAASGPRTPGEVHGDELRRLHSDEVYAEWRPENAAPASREDLHVVREWLRRAEGRGQRGFATLMKRREQESLRRILDNLEVRDADA